MQIYIETYGCTANQSDHCTLEGLLKTYQHTIVPSIETADVIILLTCTVIDTTEQRMLSRIKHFTKSQKTLIITGCMPVVQEQLIKTIAPTAYLFSPQEIHLIPTILNQDSITPAQSLKIQLPKHYPTIIAPILIAEGCQFSCSYCITHFARGHLKSYPINDIRNTVKDALDQGCKEIQLTAQDTAAYGMETQHINLGGLLNSITDISGEYRIRVGMMNPVTTNHHLSEIINGFDDNHIYKFLHLPVQSGDNLILHKMNRDYSTNIILKIIQEFRKYYPTITLATDIIVGFPQETDTQHQNTIRLLRKFKPDIVNITRFSARPITKAKSMPGRVPTHIVKQRSRELTNVCKTITEEKNKEHIGNQYTVLITKKSNNQQVIGRTLDYKPVLLPVSIPIGSFVDVKIYDADAIHLYGNLINIK